MEKLERPRKVGVAVVMAFMLPGFGQMYNGEINKAIWLFLSFALLGIPGLVVIALYLPSGWMLPALALTFVATIAIWVYGIADAARNARRRPNHVLRPWQLSGVYALTLLLCHGVALPLLVQYVREHKVASYRIPSESMAPGVRRGDVLFADMRYNCAGCTTSVRRGDVAVFTYPNDRTLTYIKRVIALPGDRVSIKGREIRVNDRLLASGEASTPAGVVMTESVDGREWRVLWAQSESRYYPELVVPPGHAFVIGDNRSVSVDGRAFGPVPLQDIAGKARQIWFSAASPEGVRWDRLGKVVE